MVQSTSSSSGTAGEAGLHEVPVAEEHGVGDGAQEGGADDEPGDREPVRDRRPRAPAATTPTTPITGATRSSRGSNSRTDRSFSAASRSMPVMAATRAVRASASATLPGDAGLASDDGGGQGHRGGDGDPDRRDVAHRHRLQHEDAHVGRASGDQQVGAPHRPAVPERHLAAAGRDPEEEQTARGPLQQDGCGVERDHRGRASGASGVDRDEAVVGTVEGIGATVGGDHDVLEAEAEAPGQVDAGLDREGVPGDEPVAVADHDVGVLVLLDADAVAGAVHEEVAVAGVVDDVAGRGVDRLAEVPTWPAATAAAWASCSTA